ncbi:D-alanyl-D-alanine carboxypeptidase [Enterococcus saccharolyticus]|uniref:serine hydrolase n=1 Tax=Enterococcus TaxID=1350 RepID=UPI001E476369|nr:serine hydrolase [Enterococcus saccharolyticus]MCD5002325.1 D-alanyl-D-alanine carboxypeptidase [Enterococcus saccharolyticus]
MQQKHSFKKIVLFLLLLFISATPFVSYADENFQIEADAAIAIDAESGKILYSQNSETPTGLASISKIISLYLVEKQVSEGKLTWDEPVTISEELAALSTDPRLANVPLEAGQNYTVKQLFDAAAIQSANAAVSALAEKIAGSEPAFVDMMREQVEAWGITDAHLVTASGLNNSDLNGRIYPGSTPDDENFLSAKDISIIARHLILDYPGILEVTRVPSKVFDTQSDEPVTMYSTNKLLTGMLYEKEGVDGLKTGTTDLAGECFVGTIERNGQRIITVVLNAHNTEDNPDMRFTETSKLMDYVYNNWTYREIVPANQEITTIEVNNAEETTVPLVTQTAINGWVQGDQEPALTVTLNNQNNPELVQAPLAKDTVLGKVEAQLDNLGSVAEQPVTFTSLIVAEDIEKASNWVQFGRKINEFFQKMINFF